MNNLEDIKHITSKDCNGLTDFLFLAPGLRNYDGNIDKRKKGR